MITEQYSFVLLINYTKSFDEIGRQILNEFEKVNDILIIFNIAQL